MKVNLINGNIICFVAQTTYEVTSTFVRMGEFYESPFPNINNKYFTLDDFMDTYASNNGDTMEYFDYWEGYNFPGETLLDFHARFAHDLRVKESYVLSMVKKYIDMSKPFYVIATTGTIALNHEYAHAQYYLNLEYKDACNQVYDNMSENALDRIHKYLSDQGYNEFTFEDETQAYLGTNSNQEMWNSFSVADIMAFAPAIKQYRQIFKNSPKMMITPL